MPSQRDGTTNGPPGKWIDDLEPRMRAVDAARLVLSARLKAVERRLPRADRGWRRGDEPVHRLRVSIRRAEAGLRAFERWLDPGRAASLRRRLKKLRRAAGDARDLDVFAAALRRRRKHAADDEQATLDRLRALTAASRRRAQKRLRKAVRKHPVDALRADRKKLLKRLGDGGGDDATLEAAAAATVAPLVDALAQAARADLTEIESIHRLRLAGKRLRYALEVFRPCLEPGFDARYAEITALQQRLGAINDLEAFADRIEQMADAHDDDIDARAAARIVRALRRDAAAEIDAFHAACRDGRIGALRALVAPTGPPAGARPAPVSPPEAVADLVDLARGEDAP